MKKIYFKSSGCRTNQEEITALQSVLATEGFVTVKNERNADIIVYNTCSVTESAESEARRYIKKTSKKYPKKKIIATGCMAQHIPNELSRFGASVVVGNSRKSELPEIIKDTPQGLFTAEFDTESIDYSEPSEFNDYDISPLKRSRTRYSLKIQEGCDFRCSYCIVPFLRGPSRSVPKEKLLDRFKRVVRTGTKEIVLTGTHIGQYRGYDDLNYKFVDLIRDMLDIEGDFRIRLSSLDPREVTEELVDLVIGNVRICDHLHMSIQSFSPDVLKGMKRYYSGFEKFKELLLYYTKKLPNGALGGDFIVGFPGESDEMFDYTFSEIKRLKFNYGHVFRYSPRPKTSAFELKDSVSDFVKTKRSAYLRDYFKFYRAEFLKPLLNSESYPVIVENSNPIKGITSNYIRVVVPNSSALKNSVVNITLKEYDLSVNSCTGELIRE